MENLVREAIMLLKLGRIHFTLGSLLLFFMGMGLGVMDGGLFSLKNAVLFYFAVFFAHVSTSYSNEFFDFTYDKGSKRTKFSGGTGILMEYPHLRVITLSVAFACTCISLVFGLYLVFQGIHYFFFILVLIANFISWSYSAPPLRLVNRGLGELATAISSGIILPGIGFYAVLGMLTESFFQICPALILCSFSFMLSVELPDIESDRKSGKMNIPARIGKEKTLEYMRISLFATTAYLFIAGILLSESWMVICSIFSIIPLSVSILKLSTNRLEKVTENMILSLIIFISACDLYLFWTLRHILY